jgi:SAM-dependent methyltransferase
MPPDAPRPSPQDEINGRLYRRADLVGAYARPHLIVPEAVVLVRHREAVVGRRVLDLGCGAGRLVPYLRPLTDHYLGLDVSPHMVAYCRRAYPGLRFDQGDMRDLGRLAEGSFDLVLAVCNLFDAVSHADRLRTLAGVRRVLAAGGLLVFSAHNRRHVGPPARPRLSVSRNPLTQLRLAAEYARSLVNYGRIKRLQREEADYALRNDAAHEHAVLHYYIDRAAQAKQLAAVGFELVECLDEMGCPLGPADDDGGSPSIHYVARVL